MERERDFYFHKLREVEILLQSQSSATESTLTKDDLISQITEILYSTD